MYDDSYEEIKECFMESSVSPDAEYIDGVAYYNQLREQQEEAERLQTKQSISVVLTTELVEEIDCMAREQNTSRDEIISDILYDNFAFA